MKKRARLALKAVKEFQERNGVEREIIRHSPLHYNMADLVHGLMLLCKEQGLDFSHVVRDAKEGL